MSDLKRFDMNGNTHINGRYCDANEAMELIEQQAAEIDALKQELELYRAVAERFNQEQEKLNHTTNGCR